MSVARVPLGVVDIAPVGDDCALVRLRGGSAQGEVDVKGLKVKGYVEVKGDVKGMWR